MTNIDSTADSPVEKPLEPAKRFDPRSLAPFNRKAAMFWFGTTVIMTIIAITMPAYLLVQLQQRERLVLLDESGTWHVAPILSFQEADTMHNYVCTIATGALLHRGPLGPDNPGLLKQVYLPAAYDQALKYLKGEAGRFEQTNIHQKVEIQNIKMLQTSEKELIAGVTGQLMRIGDFEGTSFTDHKKFQLKLRMRRNPRIGISKRLPYAVVGWKLDTKDLTANISDEILENNAPKGASEEEKQGENK